MKAGIEALPRERTGPRVQAFTRVAGLVKAGKADEPTAALDVIEAALKRLAAEPAAAAAPPAPPATGDIAARLTAALATMVPRLRALPPCPVQSELAAQIRAAQGLIVSGDTAGATTALRALAEALARAEAAPAPAPSGPKPQDIWNAAREAVDVGIANLQSALRGIGHPDTTRIAECGMAGLSAGGIRTRMMTALFTHTASSGEDRTENTLRGVIAEYRVS